MNTCTVDGCDTKCRNGTSPYCEKHYSRWKRHGDPAVALKDHTPAVERWKTSYEVDDATGCWNWTKRGEPYGYGLISNGQAQQSIPAHRFVYEQIIGPVPDGEELDHTCLNKKCVNPAHMEPVPHPINIERGHAARKAGLTHDDAHRKRMREAMRDRRARLQSSPYSCNYCGAPIGGTFFKLCEDCREKKREAYRQMKLRRTK